MTDNAFQPFPKIGRLSRDCVITEKIDGTNAQVFISEDGSTVRAASRNQYIDAQNDNHGFALWVLMNQDELKKLGPGRHYGEWWGSGIQRRYGLKEKRFSLFNVGRWTPENTPACCHLVPVLYRGPFSTDAVVSALDDLQQHGSFAAPGFMDPEGVVVFHEGSGTLFKKTLIKDEMPKALAGKP